jgi:S-adenosyl methyltransferase
MHARALLADAPHVTAVEADVRFPRHLLTMPAVRDLINFDQPVAVLLVAVLHFVTDSEGPAGIVAAITEHLAPGSYVVISHVTGDQLPAGAVRQARQLYLSAYTTGTARSRDHIGRMLDGLDLVPPGLTDVAAWRPRRRAAHGRPVLFWAGIGRTPGSTP